MLQRLISLLERRDAPFEVAHHEPVFTSAEAARVRNTSLASGAKALVCKADDEFVMIVLPADLRLASKQVRKIERLKSLRFATHEEVERLTDLAPGSIPPFGSLFGLPTWCDSRLADESSINFNAGDHAVSISMPYGNYLAIEQPRLGEFGERVAS